MFVKNLKTKSMFNQTEDRASVKEISVQEIHETFYTEVDKLLAEAKVSQPLENLSQKLVDKASRLRKLGFEQANEIKKMTEEDIRIKNQAHENARKAELIQVITYFSMKYPQYKFITEESVKKICDKYNLVYGETKRYLGTVPDKNLEQIENFKIKDEDECWMTRQFMFFGWNDTVFYGTKSEVEKKSPPVSYHENGDDFEYLRQFYVGDVAFGSMISPRHRTQQPYFEPTAPAEKCGFEICASVNDFDMSGMTISDHQLKAVTPPDPIVLAPVVYKNKKYFLIVTAWGDGASDENVVNERNN